jgi:ABC-type amino acid transport substrate-binding protein
MLILLLLNTAISALTIKLNTASQNSAPKYFLGETDNMKGLCIDIMKAIEEVDSEVKFSGYNRFVPFKRIKKMLKSGELDVFFGFVKTESREKEFIYINPPLYKVNHVVAVRSSDIVDVNSFEDIRLLKKDGKLLTSFGTSTGRYLEKQGGLYVDSSGKTVLANLKMLLRKRGRFVYYHNLGLATSIKMEHLENKIKILPTSFREYFQYVAFSKHVSGHTIEKIQLALQKLEKNGILENIFKKYTTIDLK